MHTQLVCRFVKASDLKPGDIFRPIRTASWDDNDVLGYRARVEANMLASPLQSLGVATNIYNSLAWIRTDAPCPDELADTWTLRTEEKTEEECKIIRAERDRALRAWIGELDEAKQAEYKRLMPSLFSVDAI